MYFCKEFLAMPIKQRMVEVRNRKLYINCLRSPAHSLDKCPSRGCKICNAKHNTLLHTSASSEDPDNTKESKAEGSTTTVITHSSTNHGKNHIMLSTVVNAIAYDGTPRPCRVLLDFCSQANFISKAFARTLGLQ